MRATSTLLTLNVIVWSALVYAWSTVAALPPQIETAPGPPSERCRSPEKYGGELIAVTYESERKRGPDGYGVPLHGDIFLNGHCYHFVSGGKGRGSAPFGRYQIGEVTPRPYLNPAPGHKAFPVSSAFDPIIRGRRDALFIHPGRATAGCIGIDPAQWAQFEHDMAVVQPRALNLVASGGRFDA